MEKIIKKQNKKILIAIISLILFTSIALMLIPKEDIAAGVGDDEFVISNGLIDDTATIAELDDALFSVGVTTYYGRWISAELIKNPNIFCMQKHVDFNNAGVNYMVYKVENKYTINSTSIKRNSTEVSTDPDVLKWAQGLAYLAYHSGDGGFAVSTTKREHPMQIAIWRWLLDGYSQSNIKNAFDLQTMSDQLHIDDAGQQLYYWYPGNGVTAAHWIYSKEAYTYYMNAKAPDAEYTAVYYDFNFQHRVITNTSDPTFGEVDAGDMQRLMLIYGYTKSDVVKFDFKVIKQKPDTNEALSGAVFTVSFDNVSAINGVAGNSLAGLTTNASGEININQIKPSSSLITSIKGTITETTAPTGFTKLGPIEVTFTKAGGVWTASTSEGGTTLVNGVNSISATIIEGTDIDLDLTKLTPETNEPLQDAGFTVVMTNISSIGTIPAGASKSIVGGTATITGLVTDADGAFNISAIKPIDTDKTVSVTMTETIVPDGYIGVDPITFSITYNQTTGYWSTTATTSKGVTLSNSTDTNSNIIVSANDGNIIKSFKLTKISETDSIQTGVVANVPFKIVMSNIYSIGTIPAGASLSINGAGTATITGLITDSNGEIFIDKIVPKDADTSIQTTITETGSVFGRFILSSPVELQSTYSYADGVWNTSFINDAAVQENVSVSSSDINGVNSSMDIVVEDFSKIASINVKKVNALDDITNINGAKFTATISNVIDINGIPASASNIATIPNLTVTNGTFSLTNIKIYDITQPIVITLEETDAPIGYAKIEGQIIIEVGYDPETGKLYEISYSADDTVDIEEFDPSSDVELIDDTVNIALEDRPMIKQIDLTKLNSQSALVAVEGAEFEVIVDNAYTRDDTTATSVTYNVTTDSAGKISIPEIFIADQNELITITATETYAPIGYKSITTKYDSTTDEFITTPIIITLLYHPDTGVLTKITDNAASFPEITNINVHEDKVEISANDIPIINLGGKVWEEKQEGSKLTGGAGLALPPNGVYGDATDTLLENIEVYLYKGNTLITKDVYGQPFTTVTDGVGQYIFPNVELGLDYHIEYEYDGVNYIEYTNMKVLTENGVDATYRNPITMLNVSDAYENVTNFDRVTFNTKFESIYGASGNTVDKSKGISSGNINLEYDNSIIGNNDDESDIYEAILQTRNVLPDGTIGEVLQDFTMKAKTANVLPNQAYWLDTWESAGVPNLNSDMLNLDCALVKQEVNLSLESDLNSAAVTINNKQTTYSFNDLHTQNYEITIGDLKTYDGMDYNLWLNYSDYNYRLENYLGNGITNTIYPEDAGDINADNTMTTEEELQVYLKYEIRVDNKSNTATTVNDIIDYYDESYELVDEATEVRANVAEMPYYLKKNPDGTVTKGNISTEIIDPNPGTPEIETIQINDTGLAGAKKYKQVNTTGMSDQILLPGQQITIYLTFRLNKTDDTDAGVIPDDFVITGEKANIAEINSYSTWYVRPGADIPAGMIDINSAPGNAITQVNPLVYDLHYEDDTDVAKGIQIEVKKQTNINGLVWDDINENGIYDNEWTDTNDNGIAETSEWRDYDGDGITEAPEKLIDDVIVQLIEIRENDGFQQEYIWQQMSTGGDTVSYINNDEFDAVTPGASNGSVITKKNIVDKFAADNPTLTQTERETQLAKYTGEGKYLFTNFVPGNYIIRYIYGDGRSYDYNRNPATQSYTATDNIKKYNGYDYKSTLRNTVNNMYDQEWLNLFSRNLDANEAVDNEARRLEVMAYSTIVDEALGQDLHDKTEAALRETWMCAETPKLDLAVEPDPDNIVDALDLPEYNIESLKFGLQERPDTKITLDKHISGLKIATSDRNNSIRYI